MVLAFGLVHGLGFAGALGIDAAWSWTLLWSLLVFNIGIEAVQLAIIVVAFPVLVALRRKAPTTGLAVTGAVAAGVAIMGPDLVRETYHRLTLTTFPAALSTVASRSPTSHRAAKA